MTERVEQIYFVRQRSFVFLSLPTVTAGGGGAGGE